MTNYKYVNVKNHEKSQLHGSHGRAKLTNGNSKLKMTDFNIMNQNYLNFLNAENLGQEITSQIETVCHNCETCIGHCYVNKTMRMPNVLKAHYSNTLNVLNNPEWIEDIILELRYQKTKTLRLHSSGEFFNMKYLMAWIEIANRMPELKIYTYTKAFHLLDALNVEIPANLKINLSYDDNMPEALKADIQRISSDRGLNIFYSSDKFLDIEKLNDKIVVTCKGADCLKCGICHKATAKNLVVKCQFH